MPPWSGIDHRQSFPPIVVYLFLIASFLFALLWRFLFRGRYEITITFFIISLRPVMPVTTLHVLHILNAGLGVHAHGIPQLSKVIEQLLCHCSHARHDSHKITPLRLLMGKNPPSLPVGAMLGPSTNDRARQKLLTRLARKACDKKGAGTQAGVLRAWMWV